MRVSDQLTIPYGLQTRTTAADLSGNAGYWGKLDSSDQIALATTAYDAEACIVDGGAESGDQGTLAKGGPFPMVSGAAITIGQQVTSGTDGRVEPIAAPEVGKGLAVTAASAAGETVWVWVKPDHDLQFFSVSVGTESSDVIAVTLTGALSEATRIHVRGYEATMIEAVAAALTMADGGAGSIVSTTANAAILYDCDSTGVAVIDLTDVAGASGKTFYIEVNSVNREGITQVFSVTFD